MDFGNIQERDNCINVVGQAIEAMDSLALNDFFSGYDKDIDSLMDIVLEETYGAMYGGEGNTISIPNLNSLSLSLDHTYKCESFNYFQSSVFDQRYEVNWHHLEWGNLMQTYQYLVLIAARSHSKSMTCSWAYPLWKLFRYNKNAEGARGMEAEGMIITSEMTLSTHFTTKVRDEIENNDYLRKHLFPESKDSWGKESFTCKNGASIFAKSYSSKMRGRHPHWIIVDDLLDESAMYSADQRAKFENIFNAVIMNMIEPGCQVVVVGTPFSDLDLYATLKKDPRFWVFEYPAIFPDGSLLWANRFSLEELLAKKESQGSIIFSREILVKPVSSESTIFPHEMTLPCFDRSFAMIKNGYGLQNKYKRIVLGADFAISANVGADYSVFFVAGIDRNDHIWILHMYREKGKSFAEQMGMLKMLYVNFKFDIAIVEANQMQQIFVQEMARNNIPVEGHTTGKNKYSLEEGLPSLAILFEQKRIHFPYQDQFSRDQVDIVGSELSSMAWTDRGLQGVGTHDDTVMALLMVKIAASRNSFDFTFI